MVKGRYIPDVEACDVSIGAVLSQIQENVIAYKSKGVSRSERNYNVPCYGP